MAIKFLQKIGGTVFGIKPVPFVSDRRIDFLMEDLSGNRMHLHCEEGEPGFLDPRQAASLLTLNVDYEYKYRQSYSLPLLSSSKIKNMAHKATFLSVRASYLLLVFPKKYFLDFEVRKTRTSRSFLINQFKKRKSLKWLKKDEEILSFSLFESFCDHLQRECIQFI